MNGLCPRLRPRPRIRPRLRPGIRYKVLCPCSRPPFSGQTPSAKNSGPKYYQKEITGRSLGAYCILTPKDICLLGVTESFTTQHWPGPSEFIYRGSWGPIALTTHQQNQITALCRNIQSATGLLGWLQLDFIEDSSGQLWLLELNPRWTAGMEILFLAGINPVEFHLAAWKIPPIKPIASGPRRVDRFAVSTIQFGKAIVYADSDLQLTPKNLARLHALPRENFADLPPSEMAGQTVGNGQPLLTVRTRVDSNQVEQQTRGKILQQLQQLRAIALENL